ncbi:uncharacterized protein DUF2625 [Chitinophaga dinghuensis]|uniref:Uncharacterized protein DUF2625 n=1 Tax=Chitinophaga dinghuensis TaxID=1539050 RepID=A0A327VMH5_9BACT|nr:DUF2625 domain-containing protein [Chitinophaga dinghuensis]RAJ76555.1 uncharacterized protein DUF2625 [Chitinophaga dinghuensis]
MRYCHWRMLLGSISLFITINCSVMAQEQKRPLEALINTSEPAWPLLQSRIKSAKHTVEILPVTMEKARKTLLEVQVTTRSPMGAIIYNTGGLLVDGGWIRILGSGAAKMKRSLHTWNWNKTIGDQQAGYLIVADDAVGGYFAINGGGLGTDMGKAYYFDPATLKWEALELTYSQFLEFCFNGDLAGFYKDLRWKSWEKEVATLDGDHVYNFYPMLWSKEGKDINKNSRKAVPAEEQYSFNLQLIKQLGLH